MCNSMSYAMYFGEPEENNGDDIVEMTITLTKVKADALIKAAQKAGVSASAFISENLPPLNLAPLSTTDI